MRRLTGISKLAEARDCSVHVSRSVEEAEQVLAAFPVDQQKLIFADLTLCHGPGWNEFTERLREKSSALALICYDPTSPATPLRPVRPGQPCRAGNKRSPRHQSAA